MCPPHTTCRTSTRGTHLGCTASHQPPVQLTHLPRWRELPENTCHARAPAALPTVASTALATRDQQHRAHRNKCPDCWPRDNPHNSVTDEPRSSFSSSQRHFATLILTALSPTTHPRSPTFPEVLHDGSGWQTAMCQLHQDREQRWSPLCV